MRKIKMMQHLTLLTSGTIFRGLKTALMLILVLSVVSTMTLAQGDFQPDLEKLAQQADSSSDLYVEQEFNFETFKTITMDVLVIDELGNPVDGAAMRVSVINAEIEVLTDERLQDKSLVKIARTDQFGRFYQQLELSNSVTKVLLELDNHQPGNKIIMTLDESLHLQHVFSQK